MTETLTINSDSALDAAKAELDRLYREHRYVAVRCAVQEKARTDQQRKAIEVYCRQLAEALNEAGMDQRAVLAQMREGVEIPWSQAAAKDTLWRRIQLALTGKRSTTQLSAAEVSQVYEALNRWTADRLGVSVQFPERERV